MARFLSPAWFDEIESVLGEANDGPAGATDPGPHLVLQQVVSGTPDGEVSYRVVVEGRRARIERPGAGGAAPELTIACDWSTACAIAQGQLSTQRALMQGRLRVRGSPAIIMGRSAQLANLDPFPAEVRKNTTY